ncbi:MAG: leucine-rich repeat protein, partial [Kiritimatiellaeota bacterium]|nr:leucine-rich repeat protein [Kiritimatiellota bacterium]
DGVSTTDHAARLPQILYSVNGGDTVKRLVNPFNIVTYNIAGMPVGAAVTVNVPKFINGKILVGDKVKNHTVANANDQLIVSYVADARTLNQKFADSSLTVYDLVDLIADNLYELDVPRDVWRGLDYADRVEIARKVRDGEISHWDISGLLSALDIYTAQDWVDFVESSSTNDYAAKLVRLMADIDLDGISVGPASRTFEVPFSGTLSGRGHVIRNYTSSRGLFYVLGASGTIKRLGLVDARIANSVGNGIGGMVDFLAGGTIRECFVTGYVSTFCYTGGLVGYFQTGRIEDCYTMCDVSTTVSGSRWAATGGIVGSYAGTAANSAIVNCYASGRINGFGAHIAGIGGAPNGSATLANTYALNPFLSGGARVGSGGSTLNNCYAYDAMVVGSGTVSSGDASSQHGADLSKATITNQVNNHFETVSGWDFGNVWAWEPGVELPVLAAFASGVQTPALDAPIVALTVRVYCGGLDATDLATRKPQVTYTVNAGAESFEDIVNAYGLSIYNVAGVAPGATVAAGVPRFVNGKWIPSGTAKTGSSTLVDRNTSINFSYVADSRTLDEKFEDTIADGALDLSDIVDLIEDNLEELEIPEDVWGNLTDVEKEEIAQRVKNKTLNWWNIKNLFFSTTISDWYDLASFATAVNAGMLFYNEVSLAADLDELSDGYGEVAGGFHATDGWTPIGTAANAFMGTFDGGGFSISGLWIDRPTEDNVGLFGATGAGAKIQNLGVNTAVGGIIGSNNVGALVGRLAGATTITNCYAVGTVEGNTNLGGLVGLGGGSSTIRASFFKGTVTGVGDDNNNVGGFIGNGTGTSVEQCFALAAVSAKPVVNGRVGGFVGSTQGASPTRDCYSAGSVTRIDGGADSFYFGGFAGYNGGGSQTHDCYSRAYIAPSLAGKSGAFSGSGVGSGAARSGCYVDTVAAANTMTDYDSFFAGLQALTTWQSTRENAPNYMTELDFTDDTGIWVATMNDAGVGYYPQLRVFTDNADPIIRALSLESVSTVAWHNVTFDENDGAFASGATTSYWVKSGDTLGSAPVATKPLWVFAGWNTDADGNGVAYVPGSAVTQDWAVYAQFEELADWMWNSSRTQVTNALGWAFNVTSNGLALTVGACQSVPPSPAPLDFRGTVQGGYSFAEVGSGATVIGSGDRAATPTEVVFADSVTNIGASAFAECAGITNIVLGSGLEYLGWRAFAECTSVYCPIAIPDSLTGWGGWSFAKCRFTEVTSWGTLDKVNNQLFREVYFDTLVIPDQILDIGDYSFLDAKVNTALVIGNGVTNLGYRAFYRCGSLTGSGAPLTLGESIVSIGTVTGSDAFAENWHTGTLTIPNSVEIIGSASFYNNNFTDIVFGSGLKIIADRAFYGQTNLTMGTLVIPSGVTDIGGRAFEKNSLGAIVIPASVLTIGSTNAGIPSFTYGRTFSHNLGLTNVTYLGLPPEIADGNVDADLYLTSTRVVSYVEPMYAQAWVDTGDVSGDIAGFLAGTAHAYWRDQPIATIGYSDAITYQFHTVTLDSNGGSPASPQLVKVKYGEPMPTDDIVAPTLAGYSFLGYTNSVGMMYYAEQSGALVNVRNWDKDAPDTLYATWQDDANTLEVTFLGMGGTPDVQIVTDGGAGFIAPAAPTRSGYTFVSWGLGEDGLPLYPGATFVPDTILTYYAEWALPSEQWLFINRIEVNQVTGEMALEWDVEKQLLRTDFDRYEIYATDDLAVPFTLWGGASPTMLRVGNNMRATLPSGASTTKHFFKVKAVKN